MPYCQHCGSPHLDDATFCPQCGSWVGSVGSLPAASAATPRYAGFWPRLGGWLIDQLIIAIPFNIVTDGGDHAFLIDTKTRGPFQRRGIATRVVAFAAEHARAAGCEWLHVDFDDELRAFYLEACEFEPTAAGLIHLRPPRSSG